MCSEPNSVYTDVGRRIRVDIVDAVLAVLSPFSAVTWDIDCQYNSINIPDNGPKAMTALGNNQVSASGRKWQSINICRRPVAAFNLCVSMPASQRILATAAECSTYGFDVKAVTRTIRVAQPKVLQGLRHRCWADAASAEGQSSGSLAGRMQSL